MLDSETKRRIDTARDILVGKIPDPKSQVELITITLIYKFMDDIDAESEEMGGKRKFFGGEFASYGWSRLIRSGLGGHEALALFSEALRKMPENQNIPLLFRNIFKNAYLPFRDPETLKMFLKIIDEFVYDHSERLGDAFEYLLSVLGSQGDAGQFRTPRHIIDFIVEIIGPKKNETVLDPACGTAGFLISSYKHILNVNKDCFGHNALTPEERGRLVRNFKGYDISPDMVRLSLVNLYLHGFPEPHIYEYDTLTSEDRWNEFADVILANPPFMTPKGGIRPHRLFSISSRRSEVLFLDYIISHLNPLGRAGVIVPEGIHFVKHSGHEEIRKKLISDNFIIADIALPHGVFKPYASVKTHILIIDKTLSRKTDSILFIEIENDGFSQTDTREIVEGSQLEEAKNCCLSFIRAINEGSIFSFASNNLRSYLVSKRNLLNTPGRHLLGRWHDLPNRVLHRPDIPLLRVDDICEIRDGLSPNMATQTGTFTFVVPAEDRKTADHWDFEGKAICIPLVSSAGHGKAEIKRLHYQEGKFALANTMCALFVKNEDIILPRFLYLFLSSMRDEILTPLMCGATNVTMSSEQLSNVLIPVPSLKIQSEIVESELVTSKATDMIAIANSILDTSVDTRVRSFADYIIKESQSFINKTKTNIDISYVLPK